MPFRTNFFYQGKFTCYLPLYAKGAKPQFMEGDPFKTIIPLPPETREKTTQKIMQAIVADPQITRKTLADRIGLTEDGIKYHLNSIQRKRLLRRIGPDKGGHWEIVGEIEMLLPPVGAYLKAYCVQM